MLALREKLLKDLCASANAKMMSFWTSKATAIPADSTKSSLTDNASAILDTASTHVEFASFPAALISFPSKEPVPLAH